MADAPIWVLAATATGAIASPIAAYLVAQKNVSGALKAAYRQVKSSQELGRRQFEASVISANRQKWLDALRDDLAVFISEVEVTRDKLSSGPLSRELKADAYRPMRLVFNRIQLRLNVDKPEHKIIVDTMTTILKNINGPDVAAQISALVQQGQVLAGQVWRKVKAGE